MVQVSFTDSTAREGATGAMGAGLGASLTAAGTGSDGFSFNIEVGAVEFVGEGAND